MGRLPQLPEGGKRGGGDDRPALGVLVGLGVRHARGRQPHHVEGADETFSADLRPLREHASEADALRLRLARPYARPLILKENASKTP